VSSEVFAEEVMESAVSDPKNAGVTALLLQRNAL
jgi:hypothetical protein